MKSRFFLARFRSMILLALIPLAVFGVSVFAWLYHEAYREAEANSAAVSQQVEQHFAALTTELTSLKSGMDYDSSLNLLLIRALRNEQFPYASRAELSEATRVMQHAVSTRDYLDSMYVAAPGSDYYVADGERRLTTEALDDDWLKEISTEPRANWATPRSTLRHRLDREPTGMVTFYQRLRYNMVLAVNVLRDSIDSWLRVAVSEPGRIALVLTDEGKTLLFSSGAEAVPDSLLLHVQESIRSGAAVVSNLDGYFARFSASDPFGLHFVFLFSHAQLYRLPHLIQRLMIAATLMSILLCAVVAFRLTRRDYRQIDRIIQVFESAKRGEEPQALPSRADDTPYYHILSEVIRLFLSRSYLTVQLDAKKYALLAAQLSALQYQMNPHFLFNTLQAIDLEILKAAKRPTPANRMIGHLSALLRYSLENPSEKVSIAREMEMTEHYIAVQKLKKGDQFTVMWNCSQEAARCQTLRMLLQPLVENALTHARPLQDEQLQICIDIACEDDRVTFTVTDNGAPLTQEALAALRQSIENEQPDPHGGHIGLKNIRMRVRLAYQHGDLSINGLAQSGLCVRFVIDREDETKPDCAESDTF